MNNWLVGRTTWNPNLCFEDLWCKYNKNYSEYLKEMFGDTRTIKETVDSYVFTFNVAGIPKDKVEVEVTDAGILVSAANENYSYKYETALNHLNIAPDKAKAVCQDGILTVEVPKLAVKPQKKKLLIN